MGVTFETAMNSTQFTQGSQKNNRKFDLEYYNLEGCTFNPIPVTSPEIGLKSPKL